MCRRRLPLHPGTPEQSRFAAGRRTRGAHLVGIPSGPWARPTHRVKFGYERPLAPEHLAWLRAQVARGEFASIDDAVRHLVTEHIAERMIEEDDLAWAKPVVDAALANVANGRILTRTEHETRMAALLATMKG